MEFSKVYRSLVCLAVMGLTACSCGPQVAPITPRIAVTPEKLDFGSVAVGMVAELRLNVSSVGREPLKVSSAVAEQANDISVVSVLAEGCDGQSRQDANPLVLAPGACARVVVRFSPSAAGDISNVIAIVSNDPVYRQLEIPVVAKAVAQSMSQSNPQIKVCVLDPNGNQVDSDCTNLDAMPPSIPTLNFGALSYQQSAVRTLRIIDVGTSALSVSAIQPQSSSMGLSLMNPPMLPATIDVTKSTDVQVAFTAESNGALTGNVAIHSNDSGHPEVDIPVVARDSAAPPTIQFTAPMLTQASPPLASVMGMSSVAVSIASVAPVQAVTITFDNNLPLANWLSPGSTTIFQRSVNWPVEVGGGMHALHAIVTDVFGQTGTATLQVQVPAPVCTPPTAQISARVGQSAVPTGGVSQNTTVTFDGSSAGGSSAAASYTWSLVSAPAGNTSQVVPNGTTATLACSQPGTYVVGFVVTDTDGCMSQQATVSIQVNAPSSTCTPSTAQVTASVGQSALPPGGVVQNTTVTFAGSATGGSSAAASYSWSLVSAPAGNTSQVVPNGPTATLDCSQPGTYVVGLVVTDTDGCMSHQATMSIQVTPAPPTCTSPTAQVSASVGQSAVPPGGVWQNTTVSLTGSATGGSSAAASYTWKLVSAPAGNTSQLMPNGATATLDCSQPGTYVVGLIVNDTDGCMSQQATVSIQVNAPSPTCTPSTAQVSASIGQWAVPPNSVLQNTTVSLTGSATGGSSAAASYSWSLVSAPAGNSSQIMANGTTATLDCSQGGTYVVGLVVIDTDGCMSQQATISIQVDALPPTCGPSTQFIYTVDGSGTMYRFSPSSASFTPLGGINCPSPGVANTMAVDRSGIAWVEYRDGTLFRVDTTSLKCYPTPFNPNQTASKTWGSAFVLDAPGGSTETYYISEGSELASIDTTALTVSSVGVFSSSASREPELTGTPSAQLFGFFPFSTWTLAQIDRNTGALLTQTPLGVISSYVPNANTWAFSSWGHDFWFFVGDGSTTDVFRYNGTTQNTDHVTWVNTPIAGAGVSTCVMGP